MPLAGNADSADDAVAGVARMEESIDEDTEEAALMLAAAAVNASTAEGSLVCCSKPGVALSRLLANMLLDLLDPGGTKGLFVILATS